MPTKKSPTKAQPKEDIKNRIGEFLTKNPQSTKAKIAQGLGVTVEDLPLAQMKKEGTVEYNIAGLTFSLLKASNKQKAPGKAATKSKPAKKEPKA